MTCNPQSRKCDGNHGGPRCHDPECWNDAALEADEEGVLFGYMDRSVRVSQEAYAIFLDRERALEAQVAALSQQAEPECEWPTCECALEPERCKQAEPAPAAVPDSSDTFYAGLYKKSAPMWHRLHDLAVSKGYDHVRFAIECAPVYRCDCMGARKVAIDMAGNTIPCECVAAANEAEPVRCEYCDGTGDVHRADGEWLGECKECDAAEPAPAQDGREAVKQAIAEALGEALDCTRVWSAWSYGTMGPNDFQLVAEDDGRLDEIADAAISAMTTHPAQTEQQPIQVTTVAVMRDDGDGGLEPDWLLEGGTAELMAGMVLVVAEGDITDDYGHGEVYAAPIVQTEQPVAWRDETGGTLYPSRKSVAKYLPEGRIATPLYAAPIKQAAPQPEQSGLYTCIGKGGSYELIGRATTAGALKVTGRFADEVIVYRDTESSALYCREPGDFRLRMARAALSAQRGDA